MFSRGFEDECEFLAEPARGNLSAMVFLEMGASRRLTFQNGREISYYALSAGFLEIILGMVV